MDIDQIMNMKCGGLNKFIVLNRDYLNMLSPETQEKAINIEKSISAMRCMHDKDPNPEYIVVNTDEPYAKDIISILKKYGDWGVSPFPEQKDIPPMPPVKPPKAESKKVGEIHVDLKVNTDGLDKAIKKAAELYELLEKIEEKQKSIQVPECQ